MITSQKVDYHIFGPNEGVYKMLLEHRPLPITTSDLVIERLFFDDDYYDAVERCLQEDPSEEFLKKISYMRERENNIELIVEFFQSHFDTFSTELQRIIFLNGWFYEHEDEFSEFLTEDFLQKLISDGDSDTRRRILEDLKLNDDISDDLKDSLISIANSENLREILKSDPNPRVRDLFDKLNE